MTLRLAPWLVASALATSCGSGELLVGAYEDSGAPAIADGGDAGADARPEAALDAGAPCLGKTTQPVDRTVTLFLGGQTRTAAVHVPTSYVPSAPTPVVFDFHDLGQGASDESAISALDAKADAVGFVSVHPMGISATWNGGACCGGAASSSIDDVGYVRALIDALAVDLCVDPRRVFATGLGNGGFLAQRLACELADRIAAVAPVAGVLGISTCKPARPVAVLAINGTADTVFPYGGNAALGYPPVPSVFADWASRDSCMGSAVETFRNIDAHCSTYDTCAGGAAVTQCTIETGGHTWPGSTAPTVGGYVSPNLRATDVLWQFFVAHPMP